MGEYGMSRLVLRNLLFMSLLISIVSGGCGGGGQDSIPVQSQPIAPLGPVSVLAWDPPSSYADNAALDPYRELDRYEVYVRSDGNFTEADLPLALIAAVKDAPSVGGYSGGMVLETEFILENIQPFIDSGSRHYVSLKAVGIDGQKSGFMPPVIWDRI